MTLSKKLLKRCKELFEEDTLKLCLSLSDNEEFQKEVLECSHKERIEQLEKNGFTFPKEFKTWMY